MERLELDALERVGLAGVGVIDDDPVFLDLSDPQAVVPERRHHRCAGGQLVGLVEERVLGDVERHVRVPWRTGGKTAPSEHGRSTADSERLER